MADTPENRVKKKITKKMKALGVRYIKAYPGGMYGSNGTLDSFYCINGYHVGIEAKAKYNKVTALQQYDINNLLDANGFAMVINEKNIGIIDEVVPVLYNGTHKEIEQLRQKLRNLFYVSIDKVLK